MRRTDEELRNEMIELLEADDELFIEMVNEVNNWNGAFDEARAYSMDELDEILYGLSPTEVIEALGDDFNINNDFFYDTIWGLESTDYLEEHYRDEVDVNDLVYEIEENFRHLECTDSDFWAIAEELAYGWV